MSDGRDRVICCTWNDMTQSWTRSRNRTRSSDSNGDGNAKSGPIAGRERTPEGRRRQDYTGRSSPQRVRFPVAWHQACFKTTSSGCRSSAGSSPIQCWMQSTTADHRLSARPAICCFGAEPARPSARSPGRLAPQPNLTMKGRNPETVLHAVAEWHRRLGRERYRKVISSGAERNAAFSFRRRRRRQSQGLHSH